MNHPESKLNGNIGLLQRKTITVSDVKYIGKETNNIDTEILNKESVLTYTNRKKILNMSNKEAKDLHIHRSNLWKLKKRIQSGKSIYRNKTAKLLLKTI